MGASNADRRGWGNAAQPANWNGRPQIMDAIREQDDCARRAIGERLGAIFSEHSEKGPIRSGVALRVGIDAFEEQADHLVAGLVSAVSPLAQDSGAFALIEDCVLKFLSFLDGELERILEKVEFEIQDMRKLKGVSHASERVWTQKRASILEKLEHHRSDFQAPLAEVHSVVPLPVAEPDSHRPPFDEHWHEMWADMAIRLYTGKLRPESEADVDRAMTEWFERREIGHSETEVRECARRLWQKFVAAQRISSSIKLSIRHEPSDQAAARFNRLADRPGPGTYSGFAHTGNRHANGEFVACVAFVPQDGTRRGSAVDPDGRDAVGFGRRHLIGQGAERSIGLTAPALDFD